mgnify:CR=1 FL=1
MVAVSSDHDADASRWRIDDFVAAQTSLSANTVAAYTSDVRSFAAWCARSDVLEPGSVKRATIRRYLAHLTTRQFARRSIARKTAAIRRPAAVKSMEPQDQRIAVVSAAASPTNGTGIRRRR